MGQPLITGDERQRLKFGAAVELPDLLGAEQVDPGLLDRRRTWRREVPEPADRRQVVGIGVGPVHRQQPLHDRRHRRQKRDSVVGDQPEKLVRLEARHQHEVVTLNQPDRERREAGVVGQRHRDQVDVTVLRAERVTGGGREPAVAACLDEFGAPGAAAGAHRLPHR
jgi:hypothetical protein